MDSSQKVKKICLLLMLLCVSVEHLLLLDSCSKPVTYSVKAKEYLSIKKSQAQCISYSHYS